MLAVTLSGCSMYHHAWPTPPVQAPTYELRVIQLDDFGSLWSVADARETLAHIEDTVKTQNAFVVVFIHGWHHNASPADPNLMSFEKQLARIAARLNSPGHKRLRKAFTGDPETRVIGVYVGWRGRALPGFLDYTTMWWRKAAAERVGDGDAREFVERLQRIYLRANTRAKPAAEAPPPHLMGLVTIGHSFGGQVLLNAVGRALEGDLIQRAPQFPDVIRRSPGLGDTPEQRAIDSFGDLNVLLNPALEAYQFGRIDQLYRQLRYPSCQTPQLVVFSADDDSARAAYFPIARVLTRPFRPAFRPNTEQAALYSTALGVFAGQQTHSLTRLPEAKREAPSLSEADYDFGSAPQKIRDWDMTRRNVFGKLLLEPLPGTQPVENSPVAVILTHDNIIRGHSGIFETDFWDFLVDYIGFVEAKRILWRQEWRDAAAAGRSSPCG